MNWTKTVALFFSGLLLGFVLPPVSAQQPSKIQVAVMDLEASGIDSSAILALSDRLRTELLTTGRFEVMERNQVDEILQEQGFQQTGACNTNECLIEAGRLLGVDRMIAGSVGKVGTLYTVSLRMIDMETGRIMLSKTEDCNCPIEEVLVTAIPRVALKIAGLSPDARTDRLATGDFYFKSYPAGARVFIDDQLIQGLTPVIKEGVAAGVHVIRMEKDDYTGSQTVLLEPDEFKKVELELTRPKGSLKVITEPLEAEIFLDNKLVGKTPQTIFLLDAGEHSLRLVKKGYVPYQESVRIQGNELRRVEVRLTQEAYLSVHSIPDSAEVLINQNWIGQTPLASLGLVPGWYEIKVTKKGFVEFSLSSKLSEGKETRVEAVLKRSAYLEVMSEPETCEVYIDDVPRGKTPLTLPNIVPGEVSLKLSEPFYEDWTQTLSLQSGETKQVHAVLTKKKGQLEIRSEPSNALVEVDGLMKGSTPLRIADIEYGRHQVRIIKENYQTYSEEVTVSQSGPVFIRVKLEKAKGTLVLSGKPSQAQVYLDGKWQGTLPVDELQLTIGEYFLRVTGKGYEDYARLIEIKPNERHSYQVNLTRKTRSKAVLRSLFLPGLGQAYAEKKVRSYLFPVLEIGAVTGVVLSNLQYNQTIEDYNTARVNYSEAISAEDIDRYRREMDSKYESIDKAEKMRTIFVGAAAGVWLWNVLDSAIWGAEVEKDDTSARKEKKFGFDALDQGRVAKICLTLKL